MQREDLTIDVGDGIAAWLYRPVAEAGPVPCVVLAHGFSATRDEQLDRYCELFAAAGIAAIAFDYRHFGSSGGEPRQLLDIPTQYEDIDAVLARARALDGIDPDRIAIWGTSFAGGHVLDAAARHPWLAAAVSQTPMVDGAAAPPGTTTSKRLWALRSALRDRARAALGRRPYLVPVIGPPGSRAVITSEDAWRDFRAGLPEHSLWRNEVAARVLLQLAKHRPVKRAERIACPLLVQTVENETVARNDRAERAAELAPRGELRTYPGLHHFEIYVGEGFKRLSADQVEFLRKHLR